MPQGGSRTIIIVSLPDRILIGPPGEKPHVISIPQDEDLLSRLLSRHLKEIAGAVLVYDLFCPVDKMDLLDMLWERGAKFTITFPLDLAILVAHGAISGLVVNIHGRSCYLTPFAEGLSPMNPRRLALPEEGEDVFLAEAISEVISSLGSEVGSKVAGRVLVINEISHTLALQDRLGSLLRRKGIKAQVVAVEKKAIAWRGAERLFALNPLLKKAN